MPHRLVLAGNLKSYWQKARSVAGLKEEKGMAKKTFEQTMKQLEQIVKELETGDLPLEKAIRKFEDGVKCSKYCSDLLDETEKKITILLQKQNGDVEEAPFLPSDEKDADD